MEILIWTLRFFFSSGIFSLPLSFVLASCLNIYYIYHILISFFSSQNFMNASSIQLSVVYTAIWPSFEVLNLANTFFSLSLKALFYYRLFYLYGCSVLLSICEDNWNFHLILLLLILTLSWEFSSFAHLSWCFSFILFVSHDLVVYRYSKLVTRFICIHSYCWDLWRL